MFVGCQKYGDEVKPDTMLHGVNVGDVCTTHRGSITNPLPTRFTSFLPTVPCTSIYTLLPTNELSILSCFLAFLIVDGRLLEDSVCLPVTMRLGSSYTRFVS